MGEILNQEDLENHCNDFEKTISGYGERIAVLNFEYVQDFHLNFIDKDSFEILIDRCEMLYFNICRYQQRTKYKHILGFLSVSMLCNNSKKLNNGTRIEINNKTFEILNYVMFLSGLLLKLDDSELKVQRINYTLYLLLRVVGKNFDKCVDEGKGLGNALLNVASGGLLETAAVKITSNISLVGISRTMDVIADDFTKTIANSLKEILKDATKMYDIVLIDLPMSYLKYYITCLDVIDRNFFIIENTFYKFEHFFGVRIQQLLGDSLLISKPFIQKSSIVLNKYNPYNRDKKGYSISRARIKDLLIEAGQPYDELFVVGEIPFYEDWEQQYLTNVRYLWKNEVALGVYKNILKEGV